MSTGLIVCYFSKYIDTAIAAFLYCKYDRKNHAKTHTKMYAAPQNQPFDYDSTKDLFVMYHQELNPQMIMNFPRASFINALPYLRTLLGHPDLMPDEQLIVDYIVNNEKRLVHIYNALAGDASIKNVMELILRKQYHPSYLSEVGHIVNTVQDRFNFTYAEDHGHMRQIVVGKEDCGSCWFSMIPTRIHNYTVIKKFIELHFPICRTVVFYHVEVIDRRIRTHLWLFSINGVPISKLADYLDLSSVELVEHRPAKQYYPFDCAQYSYAGIPEIIGTA